MVVVIESVLLALPPGGTVTTDGFSEVFGPLGDTLAVRLIVPEKPLRLVRVIVLVPDDPGVRLSEEGLAEMEKSPVDDTVSERFVE